MDTWFSYWVMRESVQDDGHYTEFKTMPMIQKSNNSKFKGIIELSKTGKISEVEGNKAISTMQTYIGYTSRIWTA